MHFPIRRGVLQRVVGQVKAVDGVTLDLVRGRTLRWSAIGCGKTTVGKAILQLIRPSDGQVALEGRELTVLSRGELRPLRRRIQMIFQDPFPRSIRGFRSARLSARMSARLAYRRRLVAGQAENCRATATGRSRCGRRGALSARIFRWATAAYCHCPGLGRAAGADRLRRADFGARRLGAAQILNLLKALRDDLGLAYLFITHNFAVVDYLAQDVAVMYLERIVERGSVDEVLRSPRHPYTKALLSAVPSPRLDAQPDFVRLAGETPSPAKPPSGCHFHPRCPQASEKCRESYPQVKEVTASHCVCCHWV